MDKKGKRKTAYETSLEMTIDELNAEICDLKDSNNGLQNQVVAHEKMNGMFSTKLFEALNEVAEVRSQLYRAKNSEGYEG